MRSHLASRLSKLPWIPLALAMLGIGALCFVIWAGADWKSARTLMEALPKESKDTNDITLAFVKWGTYWAAALNGVILLVLAATWKWWGCVLPERPQRTLPAVGKWGWVILLGSLMLGGWLRWERAGVSFYNDEAHTFKRYVAGVWRVSDHKWRPVSWIKTLFFNEVGNNSSPSSALGRVSYDTWSKLTHADVGVVNERAVRFPVIVASLLGCALLWGTARRLWGNGAAAAVALLAAVHFWMVRYGNEGRGYGITLLGVGLMFYALVRAWESPHWRWWLAFGAGQWLCLWSFPGAIYFVFVLDAGLLGNLLWRVWRRGEPKELWLRPFVALVVAAMVTLQLMLPTIPQLLEAITRIPSLKGPMELPWWKDVVAGLASGLSWEDAGGGQTFSQVFSKYPGRWMLALSGVILLGMGCWRLRRADFLTKWICLAGIISIPVSWVLMTLKGQFMLPWYVQCALPGLLLLLASNFTGARGKALWISLGAGVTLMGSWLGVNGFLAGTGKEPIRATYEAVRLAADGRKHLFGSYYSDVDAYDPRHVLLRWEKDDAELAALVERAQAEQAELYVSYTRENNLHSQCPKTNARLHDPKEFSLIQTFPAMDEQQFTHYLFKRVGP